MSCDPFGRGGDRRTPANLPAYEATRWKGFFFTLPVSFSWVDMDTTDVEGGSIISASPRAGYLLKMRNYGNLGLFVGASYLDSDLTAHGSLAVPETEVTIDYTVDQSNTDKWNGVLGANWDITRRWSVMVEYNGFFGSRDSIFAALAGGSDFGAKSLIIRRDPFFTCVFSRSARAAVRHTTPPGAP